MRKQLIVLFTIAITFTYAEDGITSAAEKKLKPLPDATEAATDEAEAIFILEDEADTTQTNDGSDAEFSLEEATESKDGDGDGDMDGDVFILNDFLVTAEHDRGYYSGHSLAATRTNELIKNTPVNITVINEEMLDDLNLVNIKDLTKVIANASEGSYGDQSKAIRFRGFRTNFQLYDFMPRQSAQNYYNIERADIIRGSNSLIYGQSAPGGKVNFNARRANLNNDRTSLSGAVDDKGLRRFQLDTNKVINDKFAVRVMAIDEQREYYQRYKFSELRSGTLEATYRPTPKTEFRLHAEFADTAANWVPGTYKDTTTTAGLSGMLDNLPGTPDITKYLSDDALQYIFDYDQLEYSTGPKPTWAKNPADNFNTFAWFDPASTVRPTLIDLNSKQDIKDFYAGVTPKNSGSLAYSDAGGEGKSQFHIFDVTHSFNEDLSFKFSVMHESIDNKGYRPEQGEALKASLPWGAVNEEALEVGGIGATPAERVFVNPYWVETIGDDKTTALRNTFSWEFDTHDWNFFPDSEQQFLLGLDYDHRDNNVITNQTYYASAAPANLDEVGLYGDWRPRYEWADRGVDYYPLSYTGTNPLDLVSNEFIVTEPGVAGAGYRDNEALAFRERSRRLGSTEVYAAWIALQGKYFNGRLNTLTGVRFDHLDVESEYFGVGQEKPDYQDDDRSYYYVNPQETYEKWSPSLGALFWLTDEVAVFANYSKSIESPTGWELQPDGKDIPPQIGEGVELGFKFELLDGKVTGQALVYEVEKINDSTKYSDPVLKAWAQEYAPQIIETVETVDGRGRPITQTRLNQAGKHLADTTVMSEGFEADIYYNPNSNLSLFLGYAYLDAEIQNSPKLQGSDTGIIDGDRYPGFAHHNAVFTARYNFNDGALKGWYVGTNIRYKSESFLGTFYEDIGWSDGKDPFQNSVDYVDGLPDVISVIEYDEGASRANDVNGNGKVDLDELVAKTNPDGSVKKKDPKRHEVWLSDHFNTQVFIGWRGKLFGGGRDAPNVNIQFTVDNLFNAIDLIARGENAGYTESRTFNLRATVSF
jgi:outer membrane receptor protein involved in Fe transport